MYTVPKLDVYSPEALDKAVANLFAALDAETATLTSEADWQAFRESQREVAREAVAAALVLDEVTRREKLEVSDAEVEAEVVKYAERTGRTPAAVRAALEKEGGLSRIYAGLRREKSIDFVTAHATITGDS